MRRLLRRARPLEIFLVEDTIYDMYLFITGLCTYVYQDYNNH